MNLATYPNNRRDPAVPGKPLFVSDLITANNNINSAVKAIVGDDDNGFYILSGFEPYAGSTYLAGYVLLGGQVYYMPNSISQNQYLKPNNVDVLPRIHSDGNSQETYTQYQVTASSTPGTGYSPIINASTIDSYRITNKYILSLLNTLNGVISIINAGKSYYTGDKSSYDFVQSGLNLDGNTHILDLTYKVSSDYATFVILKIVIATSSSADCFINFFSPIGTPGYNRSKIKNQISGTETTADIIVPLANIVGGAKRISYNGAGTTFNIGITVAGWF